MQLSSLICQISKALLRGAIPGWIPSYVKKFSEEKARDIERNLLLWQNGGKRNKTSFIFIFLYLMKLSTETSNEFKFLFDERVVDAGT